MSLSDSRWICLLTMTVVMLFSASEVHSNTLRLSCSCEKSVGYTPIDDIEKCYEQKPRLGCNHHAFVITTSKKQFCVKRDVPWLKKMIKAKKIECPPEFSKKRRFEVLDEDDVEERKRK